MCRGKKKKKIPQPDIYRKCLICGEQYGDQNLDAHMHSYVHHEAIEHLKGSEQLHKCWACDVSMMGLEQYKEHIATRKHTYRLYTLHKKRKEQKGLQVNYDIDLTDEEFITLQTERQKMEGPRTENCFVCCHNFPVQDLDVHMHSIVHHQAVEQLKGSPQVHKCWACDMSKTGMAEFKVHVGTLYHEYMLFELRKITADGKTVDYSGEIDDELRALCVQRDQQMKETRRERKKRWKKTKRQKALLLNQTENKKSIQLNQNLPKRRQESILDMDRSNGPLVKRPCLEKPSENLPQEMSARGITTPETEDCTSAGSTCGPGLVQSRMEANKSKLTPLQKHTNSKKSTWKVNRAASQSQQGATREGMNGQETNVDSLPSGTSLAEIFESQASGNDCQAVEIVENVQPHTVCVKKKKSNEHKTEQGETSLEHHNSFETSSCNVRKNERKKQDISHNLNPKTNDKISRKRKVNKLMTLSSKEDELTSSLEIVGDELFQAYSTLQSAYTEVQRLLAVKQQVTSEMASLREKRIKILQDMKDPSRCSTHSDQQVGLNAS
ncbi:uncharacterized protein znf106b isoform X1 [Ctenopharyngodon idella]|uniref:uncharacterized protein znf106b isoform X1 n=2 Tax=Ctenopharyngodon idella TaxID=7959 RepID=UPI002230CCD5|nr:uncharacterized protein znf106b isoform X1 [Ctenopharyngodon idella]